MVHHDERAARRLAARSAPRGRRRTLRDDLRAVAPVMGGMLFLAIVMVGLINFRVVIVPILDEQREAEHMATVGDRIAAIKSEADRQVDSAVRPPVATAVPMKAHRAGSLGSDGAMPSFLTFEPTTRKVTMDAKELLVQSENSSTVFSADETWTNLTVAVPIEDVTEVVHLRLRVEDPQQEANGDNVSVTITDGNSAFAGDLTVHIKKHASGYSVNVKVRDRDYDVIYDQGSSFFNADDPDFFWVDALSDEVQFRDLLRSAVTPFELSFARNGMHGAYTAVYYEDTEAGPILVGGAGKNHIPWEREVEGGLLVYYSNNIRYARQDLYLEAGGIVVDQAAGNTFFMEPSLDVLTATDRTVLRLTVPGLQGDKETHSGHESVPVRVQGVTREVLVGTAPHFGFNVTTDHPAVWKDFWTSQFEAAGFTEASGHFVLKSGTDWARFDFYGLTTAPASTVHDLALELNMGRVDLVMRG